LCRGVFSGISRDEAGMNHALEVKMIQASEIKPHMPVVCSEGGQFAVVDHMQGMDNVKLAKDDKGQHHLMPLAWVTKVDTAVHVDRPGDLAMREWVATA
jgi:hypothetical protein